MNNQAGIQDVQACNFKYLYYDLQYMKGFKLMRK